MVTQQKKCEHNRRRNECKDCGGASICEHNRQRSKCKECGGASICEHNRERSKCKECGGASICEHNRQRSKCTECYGSRSCQGHLHHGTECCTLGNPRYRQFCVRCFIHLFPTEKVACNARTKEAAVVQYLRDHFQELDMTMNKTIAGGCSLKRPDIFVDMGSHVIIVEVDEEQHQDRDSQCERRRLGHLFQDAGKRPMVVIRFNPDQYKTSSGAVVSGCWGVGKDGLCRVRPSKRDEWSSRLERLKSAFVHSLHHVPEQEWSIVRICFDD